MIKTDALQQERLEKLFAAEFKNQAPKITEIKMLAWFLIVLACIVLGIPTADNMKASYLIGIGAFSIVSQGYAQLFRLYSLHLGNGTSFGLLRSLPVSSAQLTIFKWRKTRRSIITCTLLTTAARIAISLLDSGSVAVIDICIPILALFVLPVSGLALALLPYRDV